MSQTISGNAAKTDQSVRAMATEKWVLRKLFNTIGNPPIRFTLWDGSDFYFSDSESMGCVLIQDIFAKFCYNIIVSNLFHENGKERNRIAMKLYQAHLS